MKGKYVIAGLFGVAAGAAAIVGAKALIRQADEGLNGVSYKPKPDGRGFVHGADAYVNGIAVCAASERRRTPDTMRHTSEDAMRNAQAIAYAENGRRAEQLGA